MILLVALVALGALVGAISAARTLDTLSDGEFGVTWYEDLDFAYECTGLNLFGYSELCREWTDVLQQKRLHTYLTPAGADLALHNTVRRCYGVLFVSLSTAKCIELLDGLLLNGADPCSTVGGYTPYDIYSYYAITFLNVKILSRLICY
jgi:hypothetical protein